MQKEKKGKHFIRKPVFPGGSRAMKEIITKNLKYPADALKNRIEGTVTLRYDINHKGIVTDAHVISGLGYGCDEEAIRLVKLFKFEVPKTRKLRVVFHKDIHIHFKLPRKQKVATKTGIQYQYQTTSKPQPKKDTETKSGDKYHYTIRIERK